MKLFQDIASIQPKLMGWCSPVKAATLASAVLALRPAVVVEVGVFGGSSFIPLALALKEIGQGIAYGIDPWSAPASADGQLNPADLEYWSKQETHDVVYNDFMRQTQQLDLGPFINIQRRKSDDADIPNGIGFWHLDGNHSDQAIRDVERYAPKCLSGSLAFLDDCQWTGGGVLRALAKLKSMGWKELYNLDTGVMLQKRS